MMPRREELAGLETVDDCRDGFAAVGIDLQRLNTANQH
jgi:hypothetical protein